MKNAALILYGLVGLGFMGLGVIYLLTDEFMPYHSDAIGVGWGDLDTNYQGLFLGLLKGLGAGAFSSGVALLSLAVLSYLQGIQYYKHALALVALAYSCTLTYAIYTVYSLTPSEPPLAGGLAWIVFSLIAIACSFLASSKQGDA